MTDATDYAVAAAVVLIGVVLTAVAPAPSVLHAAGLLCVAGGGVWLGRLWERGNGE